LLRLHTRNIPVKFYYDLPYGFRGDVVLKVWTDNGRRTKSDPNSSPEHMSSAWYGILWTILLRLHTRNIPVKFHYDLPYGFRGFKSVNGQRTTDDRRRTKSDPNSSPEHMLRWAKKRWIVQLSATDAFPTVLIFVLVLVFFKLQGCYVINIKA
jgi:hypothetical protein